ncbi:MAG: hypothetical protein IIC01_13750 [Planctomycetes bacterium]|nr:hypothetical protein [Planctomycetota bacterium]
MNDASLVSGFECFRNLLGNIEGVLNGHGTLLQMAGERLAFHVFHDQVVIVAFLVDVERGHQPRPDHRHDPRAVRDRRGRGHIVLTEQPVARAERLLPPQRAVASIEAEQQQIGTARVGASTHPPRQAPPHRGFGVSRRR